MLWTCISILQTCCSLHCRSGAWVCICSCWPGCLLVLEAMLLLPVLLLPLLPQLSQATSCGVKACPSVAVVCVCLCLLSVVVLELTWIVVARILAPLPCKVSPALCLWCWIVSPLSHVCPLVQLSFSCARPLYCFPLANCLRLKAYGYSHIVLSIVDHEHYELHLL